jgi:hypothetical protein
MNIIPIALIGGAAVLLLMKGSSLANMAKNLTYTIRLDGKPKLYAGGAWTFITSIIGASNGSKIRFPLAIDFENRSDEEVTIGVNAVFLKYKDGQIASSKPGAAQVRIAKHATTTMTGIDVDVSLSSLISIAGQAISTKLSDGDLSAVTNEMSVDMSLVLNNALVVNVSKALGEQGTISTDKGAVSGLGLVAASRRKIRSIGDYIAFIPPKEELRRRDLVVIPDGTVKDTARLMYKVLETYADDTAALARQLRRGTLEATLRNIWNFVYTHIDYVKDDVTREQVRRPLRTLYDQKGDCDCFATLIGSILRNLGIPFKFRIAAYNREGRYQHVYVVVPTESGRYFAVDPVLDECLGEKTPSKYFDV